MESNGEIAADLAAHFIKVPGTSAVTRCERLDARRGGTRMGRQHLDLVHGWQVCQRSGSLDDNRRLFKLMQTMTEILIEPPTEATAALSLPPVDAPAAPLGEAAAALPKPKKDRYAAVAPVLEKLFELYPHLFGQRFLPLKLGVFQELLAAHPDVFKRDALKAALGVHTRSTRYLQSVAAGTQRHDLQGNAVESVAPEHVFLSVVELFARQQARSAEDLKPKLARQLLAAYQASGLSRQDYLSRLPALHEPVAAVLDEVMAQVDQQRARDAALIKAFDASGKSVEEFADALGMPARQVRAALSQRSEQ